MEEMLCRLEQIRSLLTDHIIFSTGFLLLAGYFIGRAAEKMKLPVITGYIIAGLVLGRSILDIIPEKAAIQFNSITEIALGFIAIIIGAEFNVKRIRMAGLKIIMITLFQAVFAFIFVTVFFLFTEIPFPYILILAAIATATAPAATVVIVKQLRARGEFIDYLYGVVALDDAVCVIMFSIVFALSAPLIVSGGVHAGLLSGLFHAFLEIVLSCVIGFVGGLFLNMCVRNKTHVNELLLISLAVIFITTAAAIVLDLSLLIANMMLGGVIINLSSRNKKILDALEPVTPPIFAMFFVLAGTEIDLSIFAEGMVIIYGCMFLATRFAGKYAGTFLGSLSVKATSQIRYYLGLCLFPQAGVAIGLVLYVQTSPVFGTASPAANRILVLCVNIVLLSIFVNELIGPSIAKYGITKGAELE